MALTLTFLNHILPVVITLALLLTGLVWYIGRPYCKYVYAVSRAGTPTGKEELAKYLARNSGGRKNDYSTLWPSFLPAANKMHEAHISRREGWGGGRSDGGSTSTDGWGGLKASGSWIKPHVDGGSAF